MNQPLVSIIVPVYNEEKYVGICLDSLCRQSYSGIEILIVDDGSTDASADICKDYCRRDRRCKYIQIENSGVSVARNAGIEASEGELIAFCDADDWFEDAMVERMVSAMQKADADFVICDVLSTWNRADYELETFSLLPADVCLAGIDIRPEMLCEMAGAVWRCMYRRRILGEDIRFPAGLRLSEDRIFNLRYLAKCRTVFYIREPLIRHFFHEGSAVNRTYEDRLQMAGQAYEQIRQVIGSCWGEVFEVPFAAQFVGDYLFGIDELTARPLARGQYRKVKEACRCELFRQALACSGARGKRAKLAQKGWAAALFVCEKLLHAKRAVQSIGVNHA